MFLGIEIGGTKLQLGLGDGDGTIAALWREDIAIARGAEGIRSNAERRGVVINSVPTLRSGDVDRTARLAAKMTTRIPIALA